MSLNVSTNTAALRAGAYLSQNNALLQRSLDRLVKAAKEISSPIDDPGSLAVSMKLNAAINRLSGARTMFKMAYPTLKCRTACLIQSERFLTA